MFEETLYQSSADGKPFVDVLRDQGIMPGIKVDGGLEVISDCMHYQCYQRGLCTDAMLGEGASVVSHLLMAGESVLCMSCDDSHVHNADADLAQLEFLCVCSAHKPSAHPCSSNASVSSGLTKHLLLSVKQSVAPTVCAMTCTGQHSLACGQCRQ